MPFICDATLKVNIKSFVILVIILETKTMNQKFLQNAIQNLVEIYESNIDLLKNIASKCNDPLDMDLIAGNCEILRSNEK